MSRHSSHHYYAIISGCNKYVPVMVASAPSRKTLIKGLNEKLHINLRKMKRDLPPEAEDDGLPFWELDLPIKQYKSWMYIIPPEKWKQLYVEQQSMGTWCPCESNLFIVRSKAEFEDFSVIMKAVQETVI